MVGVCHWAYGKSGSIDGGGAIRAWIHFMGQGRWLRVIDIVLADKRRRLVNVGERRVRVVGVHMRAIPRGFRQFESTTFPWRPLVRVYTHWPSAENTG